VAKLGSIFTTTTNLNQHNQRETNMSDTNVEARPRVRGKIKWYNSVRGYGFVVPDQSGEDTFFHISAVDPGYELDPEEGDSVSYIVAPSKDRRVKAVEIVIVSTKDTIPPSDVKEVLETEMGK
jgi:CspA family cold shock protein